ncbi:MAG: sensor domain-containing diguanylate cyclase [Chloracidobacterium sp.]|nr:sensor domain-containing diguanylate cyclase [Chloracidobacterium sp.]
MSEFSQILTIERIADEAGLAIAVADASRELASANNNSICASLNPDGKYVGQCAAFCGTALEEVVEVGEAVSFTCHAGLECRAVPISNAGQRLVAIVGRTFIKAENYRRATERAISGDWSKYPPSEFFENVLLTGSLSEIEKAAEKVAAEIESVEEVELPETEIEQPVEQLEADHREREQPEQEISVPPTSMTAETQAWRAFFGSLLKTDFQRATESILEFLAHHYGFKALVWLERCNGGFENRAAYGEMQGRKVRLGIAADDHRLVEALQNEMPLEIGERHGADDAVRTMNLFPIGVAGEISAAVATLDNIGTDSGKKQIARMCQSIAPQLEILRLRSDVARRELIGGAVRRFSDGIKSVETDDLWLSLTQNAAEILQAERASLLVYDKPSDSLDIKSIIGSRNEFDASEESGSRVAKVIFARNEPVIVSDISKTGLPPAAERGYRSASFLSCPVTIGGNVIAVMSFTDRAGGKPFDKESLELFQAIAPQLAVSIDRATLKERAGEFEQLSVTDALTGLLNRRYIEERLMEEIKRSNRHGFPMSFMMLDVDEFKSYNDQFGHPAGDEALKMVGHIIRETLRGADVAARYGGEEFAILLPQTISEEAITIAERIRSNIAETAFPHRRVTLSIGVASCSAELCLAENIVSAADKALYHAKHNGRNRVQTFEDMAPVQAN